MIIHFICRGNAFRSIIAEAYLNSLAIKDLNASSSGTIAAAHKPRNLDTNSRTLDLLRRHGIREYAKAGYGDQLTQSRLMAGDVTVCLNQRVYDDCLELVTFSTTPLVWSVADLGEPGRVSSGQSDKENYRDEAYREIVKNVDQMISGIAAQSALDASPL